MKDNIIYHSHLGVYGLILKPKSIVLVKKSRGPYKGLFDLPGGSLEIAETLEEALVREIREETGCLVKQYDQIQTVTSLYHYNEDNVNKCLKHIAVLYKIEIIGEIKRESDGKDSDGCIWQSIDTINYKKNSPIVHIASIAFLIIVRTGHRKAESTARRKDSNRGMFFLALFFIANQ